MCETLYNDSLRVVKQAALYLLSQEEEEREEPPGAQRVASLAVLPVSLSAASCRC